MFGPTDPLGIGYRFIRSVGHFGLSEPPLWGDLMPLLSHYGKSSGPVTPVVSKALAGAHDIPTFTRNLFGVRRYRSDLARAVAQSDLHTLGVAWALRQVAPVDWIVQFLNSTTTGYSSRPERLERTLRNLDERSIRRLCLGQRSRMLRGEKFPEPHIVDISRMPFSERVTRVDSWQDLHDKLARAQRDRLRREEAKRLGGMKRANLSPELTESIGAVELALVTSELPDGLRIVLPDNGIDLLDWGYLLDNCIGGYSHQWNAGQAILGAIEQRGMLVGAFEVQPVRSTTARWKLVQLLGRRNAPLHAPARTALEAAFRDAGVTVTDRYWGAADRVAP